MNGVDETFAIPGKILQSPPPPGLWSSLSFSVKTSLTLACLFAIYVASARAWRQVLRWREKSFKLAVRRQHGIPDSDRRPFNVAYAAVMRARRDQERPGSRASTSTARSGMQGSGSTQAVSSNAPDQQQQYPSYAQPQQANSSSTSTARQRQVPLRHMDSSWSTPGLPGRYLSEGISSALPNGRPRTVSSNSATLSNTRGASIGFGSNDVDAAHSGDDVALDAIPDVQPSTARGSKRGLDDDVEGAQVGDYYYYDDGDEASGPSKRKRDKRARKISLEKGPNGQPVLVEGDDDDMSVDDGEGDDLVGALRSIVRGRKRDRAEAGSTFGGDDDEESIQEEEVVSTKERRRRKRRTVSKRKSDAGTSLRGQKRDRGETDDEDLDDDEEDDVIRSKAGKRKHTKRGKRDSHVHEQIGIVRYGGSGSDVSMDGSGGSGHPSCKGRKVGEEWESSGVQYKVGINGERLRRTLIRQERTKFPMPADSIHPDRDAGVEIFVDRWLTDAEYKVARSQQLSASLSPASSTEPETPRPEDEDDSQKTVVAPAPPPVGKNLLYEAPGTPSQRRYASQYRGYEHSYAQDPFRQSVATNIGLRPNPRRIAVANARIASPGQRLLGTPPASPISLASPTNGSLADSTNINGGMNASVYRPSPRRMYSKWEKQDMEAAAMRQVREAARRKEREEKEAKEKANAATATPATTATTSTFTLTPAAPTPVPSSAAPTPSPSPFSFGKPAEDKEKAATPAPSSKPAPSIGFGFPPAATTSADASKPTGLALAPAPAAAPSSTPHGSMPTESDKDKAKTEAPVNPFAAPSAGSSSGAFSFGRPPVAPASAPSSSTSAPAPSSTIPNFFNKPTAPTTTTSSKPVDSPLKFSFGPLATPAAPTPTVNTPVAPIFGGFPNPSSTAPPATGESKSGNAAQGSGGLLGRVGGLQVPTPPPQPAANDAPKFSFGFGKPAPASSAPAAAQSAPAPGSGVAVPNNNVSGSSTGATTTPKFSFGFGSNKTNTAPSTMGTSGDANKPPAPTPAAFGFGAPKTTAETKMDTTSTTSGGPKFSFFGNNDAAKTDSSKVTQPTAFTFGASSASSPFGSAATSNTSAFGAAAGTNAGPSASSSTSAPANPFATTNQSSSTASGTPTPAFAGFSAPSASKPNPFGSTTAAGSTPVFGGGASGAATGGSVFGSTTGGGLTQPNPGTMFGSTSAPTTSTTAPDANKPAFSFSSGNTAASSKPASVFGQPTSSNDTAGTPKMTFAFGASPAAPATTTPAATPAAGGSTAFNFPFNTSTTPASTPPAIFGNTTTPANGGVFAFGNTSTTSNTGTGGFTFGQPSTPSKQ